MSRDSLCQSSIVPLRWDSHVLYWRRSNYSWYWRDTGNPQPCTLLHSHVGWQIITYQTSPLYILLWLFIFYVETKHRLPKFLYLSLMSHGAFYPEFLTISINSDNGFVRNIFILIPVGFSFRFYWATKMQYQSHGRSMKSRRYEQEDIVWRYTMHVIGCGLGGIVCSSLTAVCVIYHRISAWKYSFQMEERTCWPLIQRK